MTTFTIDGNNNITLHATRKEAETVPDSEHFCTMEQLTGLAAKWPSARMIEIWNNIPGNAPVKKFTDRKSAVTRIWKAIQAIPDKFVPADRVSEPVVPAAEEETSPAAELVAQSTEETPTIEIQPQHEAPEPAFEEVEPEAPSSDTEPNGGQQAPDVAPAEPEAAKKATRKTKTPRGEKEAKAPREASKTSRVIEMLKREGGTTLEEIMSAMSWQKHTTRAMMSAGGSLAKKHGLVVTSEKVGEKRIYSIKA